MWNVIVIKNSSFTTICDGFADYRDVVEYMRELDTSDVVSIEIYRVD